MKPLEISSAANAQYKTWLTLLSSKGIKENLQFFLMGSKLIEEFLNKPTDSFRIEYVILHGGQQLTPELDAIPRKTILSKELFKELDVLGTNSPLIILSYEKFLLKDPNQMPKGLELVCPLGDPRNLGALIRSAVGFGASEMILTQESTHPFLPQSIKASAGAALKMKFSTVKEKLAQLPLTGENFALELHGTKLHDVQWPTDLRLWVGEEGPGLQLILDQKKKMKFITIPTKDIESLNATTSTTLALWEWKKSQAQT